MKEKLLNLMKSEKLTSSRLAEILEIQPSGISHILSGRNKPGFDLLQKILRRFPRINPDWLLLDSNRMYRDEPATTTSFDNMETPPDTNLFTTPMSQTEAAAATEQTTTFQSIVSNTTDSRTTTIERIVIFYNDHTFDSFNPKNQMK